MSTSTTNSGIVNRRPAPVRKPRPLSIAGTGVTAKEGENHNFNEFRNFKLFLNAKNLSAKIILNFKFFCYFNNLNLLSIPDKPQSITTTPTSSSKPTKRPSTASRTPSTDPASKPLRSSSAKSTPKSSTTPSQQLMSPSTEVAPKITKHAVVKETVAIIADDCAIEKTIINNVIVSEQKHTEATFCENNSTSDDITDAQPQQQPIVMHEIVQKAVDVVNQVVDIVEQRNASIEEVEMKSEEIPTPVQDSVLDNADMTASMIAKTKITTEEEAKAKIAERRRIAREEAERQAELERKRIEEQEELERQRQAEEEERQRQMETEALRLAEEQRRIEEERLQQAIEENQKREEEEKKRKEEENRQKLEREQAEKKAREDAEKAKAEQEKKRKEEEVERLERKKRVEAIMARTRKGQSGTPSKVNFGNYVTIKK